MVFYDNNLHRSNFRIARVGVIIDAAAYHDAALSYRLLFFFS